MAAMATLALLFDNSFPNDRPAWDGLVPSAQIWTAWKLKFVPLQSAMERELRASSQWYVSFGSAHPAMVAHGISAASPIQPPTDRRLAMPLSSKEMMAQFNGHLDNLSSAATNSGAALHHLTATTTTQYSEIKALITLLKAAAVNTSHAAADATSASPLTSQYQVKKRIQKLEVAVRNNWHHGAFCSTHE